MEHLERLPSHYTIRGGVCQPKLCARLDYSARLLRPSLGPHSSRKGFVSSMRGVAAVVRAIYSQTLTAGYVHTPWSPPHTGSPPVQ